MLRKFRLAEAGNVAMMFGLVILPLIAAAGIAIDLMRAEQIRSAYQDSADAAVLAAARAKLSN